MSLLFIDGFEGKDLGYKYNVAGGGYGGIGGGPASTWQTGRFSGVAFSAFNYASQGPPYATKFITPSDTVVIGVAVSYSNPPATVNLLRFFTDAGASLQLTVRFINSQIEAMRGTTSLGISQPNIVSANSWGYLEVKLKVDPVAGSLTVKYNGTQIINFTGNTKNTGTNLTLDAVQLYFDGGSAITVDDFYILNTVGNAPHNDFLGDVRVAAVIPNGAGSVTGFTSSSGANYTTVDEAPPSGADYVQGTTSGTKDLYAMSDVSNAPVIYGVQTNVLASKTDSGDVGIYPLLKTGGVEYRGASKQMTASWQMASDLRQVNPNTANAWTQSDVNGLEAGVEIV